MRYGISFRTLVRDTITQLEIQASLKRGSRWKCDPRPDASSVVMDGTFDIEDAIKRALEKQDFVVE